MRNPSVAGQFYPSQEDGLREQIEGCFLHALGPGELPAQGDCERDIVGAVVPHAGYMYSGPEAAHVYHALTGQRKPSVVIALGPNHTGMGSAVALSKETWKTPLGETKVDEKIADTLWKKCGIVDLDEDSHRYEHSIEVQLPLLQYIYGDFKFVPISLGIQDLEASLELAECIAIEDSLILASSDFTHYEPKIVAFQKDNEAIKHLLAMDEKKFIQTIYDLDISACGYGPIAACLAASKKLGATKGELLKYGSSGDITGDNSRVVAYAAIVFRR
jgi:hypothetical protein